MKKGGYVYPILNDPCLVDKGLTRLDYFAGMALQGILASRESFSIPLLASDRTMLAREALEIAQQMVLLTEE